MINLTSAEKEPEPPQQIQGIRAGRRRRPAGRLQIPQIRRDRLHHHPVGIDEPPRLPRIARGDHTARMGHDQRGQIPRRLLHGRSNDPVDKGSLTSQNGASSSVNK
jgi:hypothetical protein